MESRKLSIFILPLFGVLLNCCSPKPNGGIDFIGVWESGDLRKVRIEIKEQIREGVKQENRYYLTILDKDIELPKNYIDEGQYNYWFVTAKPEFNRHPFQEFIHKNSFKDTIAYIAHKDKNKDLLIRRYKGLPDLIFKKVK